MEHKLLLGGGEKFLPFARSRIKALRAAGLEYATQRFILPDARIRVQLVGPNIEYIEIIGGELVTIEMDSGVVDVGSIAEFGLQTYAAGILHETAHVQAYNVGFELPESGQPPRLKDTPGTSAGQFSGILTKSTRFAGRVPIDGQVAQSFEQGLVSDFQTPPTWITNTRDQTLKAKKTTAILCPASMFTGRCRLWVQALYGAFLYDGPDSAQVAQMPYVLTFNGSGRPGLTVTNRNKRTTAEIEAGVTFSDVSVTTGSGVHLDPATGKHWLFCFSAGLKVYPLLAPKAIERLRQYLITVDPPEGLEVLSAEDREHLETYILSKSLPNGNASIEGTATADPFSMGYSWHWNWDGLVADAVVHEQYEQTYPAGAMRSSWYRITMTLTDGVWSVLQTTVEGPTDWALSRTYWTITEPNFATFQADKITPKFSNLFACDAPVYVFYRRNEIQVARVAVTLNTAPADTRETSPNFSNSEIAFGDMAPRRTLGLGGGSLLDTHTDGDYYSANFSCGAVSFGPLDLARSETNYRDEISEKTPGAWFPGFGGYIIPVYDIGYVSYGPPLIDLSTLPYNYAQFSWPDGGTIDDENQTQQVTYTHSRGGENVVYSSRATLAVPFYDAEAVYLEGYGEKVSSWFPLVSSYTTQVAGFVYVRRTLFTPARSPQLTLEQTCWRATGFTESIDGALQVNSETNETIVTNTQTLSGSYMVGHPGEVAATFTNLSQFHNNAVESVDAPMYTLTGTRDDLAVATGNIEPVGMPTTNPAAPVIVGWV